MWWARGFGVPPASIHDLRRGTKNGGLVFWLLLGLGFPILKGRVDTAMPKAPQPMAVPPTSPRLALTLGAPVLPPEQKKSHHVCVFRKTETSRHEKPFVTRQGQPRWPQSAGHLGSHELMWRRPRWEDTARRKSLFCRSPRMLPEALGPPEDREAEKVVCTRGRQPHCPHREVASFSWRHAPVGTTGRKAEWIFSETVPWSLSGLALRRCWPFLTSFSQRKVELRVLPPLHRPVPNMDRS